MTGPDARAEYAWLIERGQPEGQVPTVWALFRKSDDYLIWTEDANEAEKFPTRAAAEAKIAQSYVGGPRPTARAVEHGWLADEETRKANTLLGQIVATDFSTSRGSAAEQESDNRLMRIRQMEEHNELMRIRAEHAEGRLVETNRRLRELDARHAQTVEALEQALRREWWLNHGHGYSALYGDDGEMQCNACPCDFKRTPFDELQTGMPALRARAALAADTDSQQAAT